MVFVQYTPEQREAAFWAKIQRPTDPDACWLWTGSRRRGYGRVRWNGRLRSVTHIMLERVLGRPLRPGFLVAHTCDNPPCVRPEHLWEATESENQRDSWMKGRRQMTQPLPHQRARGERHANAKLTADQVREIRRRYRPTIVTAAMLADEYRVTKHTIRKIVEGDHWKHLL